MINETLDIVLLENISEMILEIILNGNPTEMDRYIYIDKIMKIHS